MSLKLFIFDCDGTIVDSAHTIVAGMAHSFEKNGLKAPSADETHAIIGLSLPNAIENLADGDISGEMRDRLVEGYRDYVITKP